MATQTYIYDLSTIEGKDMTKVYQDDNESILDSLKLKQRLWRHNGSTYKILRYDKDFLTTDRTHTCGLFRSVIHRNSKILAFAPPKAEESTKFQKTYAAEECKAEEYVEGTMINVFYDGENRDNGEWEISTRSCVGANITYFKTGKVNEEDTFKAMFLEACKNINFDFNILPKEFCYTFVFQHPRNRIVIPFTETAVYFIAGYKIENYKVTQIPREDFRSILPETIQFPEQYEFESYCKLRDKWASPNTDYKYVGVMVIHKETGIRTKFRNPSYEYVRQLRGNQPKLQYTYIALRQSGKVNDYMRFYPEVKKDFTLFRNQIHDFTNQLHKNYITCYINKAKPLGEYPFQFRSHMHALHTTYIDQLREHNMFINRPFVIDYVNELHPAKLMFSLNYCMRQFQRSENTIDTRV